MTALLLIAGAGLVGLMLTFLGLIVIDGLVGSLALKRRPRWPRRKPRTTEYDAPMKGGRNAGP